MMWMVVVGDWRRRKPARDPSLQSQCLTIKFSFCKDSPQSSTLPRSSPRTAAQRGSITRMRRLAPALAIVSTLLFVAPSAEAITRYSAKQLAASLAASHIFVQPGVAPQPDSAALKAVAAQTPSTYLLILRRQVKGAKTSLESAKLIIAALKKQDPKATVGLIAKGQLAGSSLSHPQERVDKAVKDSRPSRRPIPSAR